MTRLIDERRYQQVDLPIFQSEFADFLPPFIYDAHVHLALEQHRRPVDEAYLRAAWPNEVDYRLGFDELAEVQSHFFPGREVRSLAFTMPSPVFDIKAGNAYIAGGVAEGRIDGLLVPRPEWPAQQVRELLRRGRFVGLKPYPGLAGERADESLSIDRYFTPAHQEIADELGLIVILHLPRPERLRDPRNLAELHQLVSQRPRLRLIIAHIGRAYTMTFAEPGLQALRDLPTLYHDFAMNLNSQVIELALEEIGPQRLLYGSDLPVCLMRGVREHRGDAYINFSDGDYLWNTPDKRKPPEVEAGYTFYIYEELRAFKGAAQRLGLGAREVAAVMGGNARRLVAEVKESLSASFWA